MPKPITYQAVKAAFMDGELDLHDGALLLAEIELAREELREWQLIMAVEAGLQQAAQSNVTAPWMGLKVENELQLLESAKQWLGDHPRGLLGATGLGTHAAEWRIWMIQLAVVGGGAACAVMSWWLISPLVSLSMSQFNPVLVAASLGGLIALAALRWPELRGYYTS